MTDPNTKPPSDEELADVLSQFSTLESTPMEGYVVHQVANPHPASAIVWAWCKVEAGEPGYRSIDLFTEADGVTEVDPLGGMEGHVHLGPVLFQLFC